MAHSRRLVILAGFILGAGAAWLRGAEPETAAQITALWLDGRRPAGELFVADAKGQPQKLVVGLAGRGAPLPVRAAGQPITVLRKAVAPVATGGAGAGAATAGYETAGEIAWPTGGSRKALLVLMAGSANGGALVVKGVALADDVTSFPPGHLRVANFLGAELIAKVGTGVKPVPAGVTPAVPYPVVAKVDEKRVPNFPLALARVGQGGPAEVIFNGWVDAWPSSRTLVLVFPGSAAGADPVVRTVVESIPVPAN